MDLDWMVPTIPHRWIISQEPLPLPWLLDSPLSRFPSTEQVYNPLTYFLPAGWSAVPEEKASRYRLSIKDVQPQDSGTYTCASPRGLTNSIIIQVAGNSSLNWMALAKMIDCRSFLFFLFILYFFSRLRQFHNAQHWLSRTLHYRLDSKASSWARGRFIVVRWVTFSKERQMQLAWLQVAKKTLRLRVSNRKFLVWDSNPRL